MESSFLDKLSKVATIIIAFVGLYFSYKTSIWDDRFKAIDIENKSTKFDQEKISFDREFKFKVYQLTIDAIKSKDQNQQEAAYIVVNNLVTDTTFKTGLLNLFAKSNSVFPKIKNAATVASFDISESQNVYSIKDKILVDVFYLESKPKTRETAVKIQDALKSSDFYTVRLRKLKTQTNNSNQYKIKDNLIRFDSQEMAKAEKLASLVNQLLNKDGFEFSLQETKSGNPTEQYLSLFIVTESNKEFSDEFN